MAEIQTIPDTKGSATPRIVGQRDRYFTELFEIFKADKHCVMITADNGAPSLDQFAEELPKQFIQVGIAEQQMFGMAAGLAVEGKKVFCYAIAPFVTTRVHEFIKLDVCAMDLPIVLLGVGAGYAYAQMGPSHHTVEDISIMRALPNLVIWSPCDGPTAAALARRSYKLSSPQYIRFDRAGVADIYEAAPNLINGFAPVLITTNPRPNRADVCILATSAMVQNAINVARLLGGKVSAVVVDVYRLKPILSAELLSYLQDFDRVVTLEEHFLNGGLGSIVAEIFADNHVKTPLYRMGIPDEFVFDYGGRENIWRRFNLDAESVAEAIKTWTRSV